MLPVFFSSPKGESGLKEAFSHWRFCSVDTKEIVQGADWKFLFANADKYVLKIHKAFIHIGAPKTGSTSLQDTMAMDRSVLKDDKYFLALHGQVRKPGTNNFIIDNMLVECDKLGACIWSDEERKIVLEGSRTAGICPDFLPLEFNNFLTKAKAAKSDVVISNEWLNRPSSETGLLKILDGWDLEIVIYYRRFFDWIISAHYQWHFDIGTKPLEALNGKIRLVDFLRTRCAQLFEADPLLSNDGLDLVDLTDLQEYTYHAWKRYNKIPQYDNSIKIVNFHGGNIVQSFYCDVLEAESACKLESGRSETLTARSKTSTIYFDLAVRIHWLGHAEKEDDGYHTKEAFQIEADEIKERMSAMGFNEGDLPKECLTEAEKEKLLSVSLAYERILLPKTYALGGEKKIKQQFADFSMNNLFCSVDLNIIDDPKWAFLFQ